MIHSRPATESDLDALLFLLPQITSQPNSPAAQMPDVQTAQKHFLHMQQTGQTIFVAESDQKIVGTCTLVILPTLMYGGRPFAQLEHVVVAQNQRGQGIGSQLIQYAIQKAKEANCYKLQLLTGKRDTQINFYKKQNFDDSKTHGFKTYLI
jgi:GNAT superfamily N-acetyltransferase